MAMGTGGLAVLFGGGVLFEWALRDPATTGELLSHQLVQPLTAACLVGTGIGVLGVSADRSKRWAATMRRIAAGGLLCVGAAVSAEYMLGIDLGIDRLLFRDVVVLQIGAPFPGRPSIMANIEMLLIGLTLALDDASERWGFAYAATATLAALLALTALVGYAYQAEELYDNPFYTSIGVRAAAVAFLQCIGLLAMRPERGWVGQLGSLGVGGTLVRRLFPPVIVTPLLLGWVLLQLDRRLGLNPDFPLALFAVTLVPVLCTLVLWVARALDEMDQRRRSVEEALRKAKVEAEQATLAKSQFLASVSHDLRQPVQSLVLFMALLQERVLEPSAKNLLAAAQQVLDGLKLLLDGLLDLSKLDASLVVPKLAPVSLGRLFERMRNEYTGRADEAGLKLTVVPCSLTVRSDPMLLERMLRNLIENAIRFTRQGAILIGCRRRGDRASIEVLDTGIGIAAADQKAIFEEFHQLNNPERSAAKGLGLGLSIVRRMGRLLGHDVTVDSDPGKGSRFAIDAPVLAASDLETHIAPPKSAASSGALDDRPKVGSICS
jgi:signal transduction histidine kinase